MLNVAWWLGASAVVTLGQTINAPELAVQASVESSRQPPSIQLRWRPDPSALGYAVARRDPGAANWRPLAELPGTATAHLDSTVSAGIAYEYKISKIGRDHFGYGYLYAGIDVPLTDYRGKVILVVDNTYAAELAFELARLQQDLVGDGWIVIRRDVAPDDSVTRIKQWIKAEYDADPSGVKCVFLFGRVPVPYSGNIAPDEHPNHQGAWPADSFYADMDGLWTDHEVNTRRAERIQNWNVPGDGKFDQSTLPSDLELQIGRVDLSRMTAFSNKSPARSERDLLRQYLDKNHRFRHRQFTAQRRGLICDNFGRYGDPISSSAWRNFAPFFGTENIVTVEHSGYFPALAAQSYLWSFGSGGGGYTTCDGIGSSDDFARHNVQSVFTMLLGSFFGDWDNESNLLRAALGASGYTLAAVYSGFPHWHCHHMALGETIGFSTLVSQNNRPRGLYPPHNVGTHQVHIALMGDPTLRMHPVIPPANLTGIATDEGLRLQWEPSTDSNLVGYHVYRSTAGLNGPFARITGTQPVADASFVHAAYTRSSTYMVRAVKLEQSASGTYFNASQGIFFSAGRIAQQQLQITASELQDGQFQLRLTGPPGLEFTIDSSTDFVDWRPILTDRLSGSAFQFSDRQTKDFPRRFYRARKSTGE